MSATVKTSNRWDEFRTSQREDFANSIIEAVSDSQAEPLSVTDIVRRTGTSRKTFYKYFDSLTAAIIYTQQSVLRRVGEHAQASVAPDSVGRDRLLSILCDQGTLALEAPALFRFQSYFDYTFRRVGMGPDDQSAYASDIRALGESVIDLFRAGQADGSIRTDLDPELTVLAVSGAIIGLVQRSLVTIIPSPSPTILRELLELEASAWRAYLSPSR
jgi:AcrR family transcriptional regulator